MEESDTHGYSRILRQGSVIGMDIMQSHLPSGRLYEVHAHRIEVRNESVCYMKIIARKGKVQQHNEIITVDVSCSFNDRNRRAVPVDHQEAFLPPFQSYQKHPRLLETGPLRRAVDCIITRRHLNVDLEVISHPLRG